MSTVLFPLPDHDFDPTEVAVPWRRLRDAGHDVVFATETGRVAPEADPRLLTGVLLGQLGAAPEPLGFYEQLTKERRFRRPISWSDVNPSDFDGLVLAGGHAPGMRQYLGSQQLQAKCAEFFLLERPVGAICHGVVVLARAKDPSTGASVLASKNSTSLTKSMERTAYYLTAWRLGRYYRTYPSYVEDEVRSVLNSRKQFHRGPRTLKADSATRDQSGFVIDDGHYLSARWPGDAYTFARRFVEKLNSANP
jgi:putative intracellular protease/amidase